MTKLERLQRELEKRYKKRSKRKKASDWHCFAISPNTDRADLDYIGYVNDGKAWCNKTRLGAKIKQFRNGL